MNATAITYAYVTVTAMTGETIKSLLEDYFNPIPAISKAGTW